MTRPPCRATHDALTCCRTNNGSARYPIPHAMPHMAADGTQWDEHGVRQNRGNDPWKGEVA